MDADRHGAPAALAAITGWGNGYRRPDGVSVVPIGALAPWAARRLVTLQRSTQGGTSRSVADE